MSKNDQSTTKILTNWVNNNSKIIYKREAKYWGFVGKLKKGKLKMKKSNEQNIFLSRDFVNAAVALPKQARGYVLGLRCLQN